MGRFYRPTRTGSFHFLPTVRAQAIDLEGVARSVKVVLLADLLLDAVGVRCEELNADSAVSADHVMVAAAVVLVLVTRDAVMKGDLAGESAVTQQLERAIDGGET